MVNYVRVGLPYSLQALYPEPYTLNPKPYTLNPQPYTLQPKS